MIAAAALYPSMLLLLGLASVTWQLSLALFSFGFCGNLLNISINTQAIGVEAAYGRSIMASFHGLWSLAGFTGAALSTGMIALRLSPFQHFCFIAAAAALLIAATCKYALPANRNSTKQTFFAKPDKAIFKLGLIAFGSLVCEGPMFDWSSVYFDKVLHVTGSLRTAGYIAFMGSMATGRFIADMLATKLALSECFS